METPETPKPLWRRKRWVAAGVLWLLAVPVLYFLAEGPFAYAAGYGGRWSDAIDVLLPGFAADPFLGGRPSSGLRAASLDAWAGLPHFRDVGVRREPAWSTREAKRLSGTATCLPSPLGPAGRRRGVPREGADA